VRLPSSIDLLYSTVSVGPQPQRAVGVHRRAFDVVGMSGPRIASDCSRFARRRRFAAHGRTNRACTLIKAGRDAFAGASAPASARRSSDYRPCRLSHDRGRLSSLNTRLSNISGIRELERSFLSHSRASRGKEMPREHADE